MITEVTMPVLGLTMEQGTIVGWLKDVGDRVEAGEALFMVETDKATSDAPSPATGILARVLAGEGATVAVGKVVALLAESAAGIEEAKAWSDGETSVPAAAGAAATTPAASAPPGGPPPPAESVAPAAAGPASERLFVSPRARARARELGVDLAVAARGAGRLTEKDVLGHGGAPRSRAPLPPLPRRRPRRAPVPSPERCGNSAVPARSSRSA